MAITLTRKQALNNVIAYLEGEEIMPEEIEVLTRMLASIIRAESKPKGESRTARENGVLAKRVFENMPEGEENACTWDFLACRINGILTAQKFTAVVKPLIASGQVAKTKQGKRTAYYRTGR